jgi:hypothetical protein
MTLIPVSIWPLHTCRTAHIFALIAKTTICSIFLEQIIIWFFLEGQWSGLKFRVSRVSGNTFFFPFSLSLFIKYTVSIPLTFRKIKLSVGKRRVTANKRIHVIENMSEYLKNHV